MILTQCAACAKPLAHDAPRCVRCWTRYCDASCELEHWSAGQKKQCKKIARGGGAEQFYADAKAKEALEAAVVESAPRIPADAICYICRNDGSVQGLVSGCGCHGGAGIAHVTCLVRMAQAAVKEYEETGCGRGMQNWDLCIVCGHKYHGAVSVALNWAMWKTYLGRSESDKNRCCALTMLGQALVYTDAKAALPVLEAQMVTFQRFSPHLDETVRRVYLLFAQENMASCYEFLGQYEEALRLRTVFVEGCLSLHGRDSVHTILAVNNRVGALVQTRRAAEARQVARQNISVARRALGDRHPETIKAMERMAEALGNDAAATRTDLVESVELLEDAQAMARNVYGSQHPKVLESAGLIVNARRTLAEFPLSPRTRV